MSVVTSAVSEKFGDSKMSNSPIIVNAGLGACSYFKNSYYQKIAGDVAKDSIENALTNKLDVKSLSSSNNTIRVADFGCAVGPNTFTSMQELIEIIKNKYQSQCPTSKFPDFQVFFNDQPTNDFNTLFTSLPRERDYFVAGVPGSFQERLFPESSLHCVHTSYALHWLSKLPEEVLNKKSPAFNRGMVHYAGAPDAVVNAYAGQFDKDLDRFLSARAQELAVGGMMVVINPSIPDELPYSITANGMMYQRMASILKDMIKEGLITEDQLDTFNLPIYACPPGQFAAAVERDGNFRIETIGLTDPAPWLKGRNIDMPVFVNHVRAAMEGMYNKHFPREITNELFEKLVPKLSEISLQLEQAYRDGLQLFAVLQRI